MATVQVLAPQAALDTFGEQALTFLRQAQPTQTGIRIVYQETVGADVDGTQGFSLDDTLFTKLQLYIAASFVFPKTPDQFRAKYPFADFHTTNLKKGNYELIVDVLTTIHQHCAIFQTNGINPMIELSHSIANFADEVVTLVGALKEQLDVICDANIQLSSPRSKQARRDAKEILHMLKSNSAEVHERCKEIHHVTSLFRTQTLEDEKGLKGLIELLDAAVTEFMLYDAISKKMEEIRDSLLQLSKQQSEAASKVTNKKVTHFFCQLFGINLFFDNSSQELKDALQELEKINIEYNIKICDGNRQKLALINSVDRIHGLSHSIDNITEHIAGAQACLQNMMDGMSQMKTNADSLIRNLESLEGRVMPESHASGVIVKISVDRTVKAWNMVFHVARQFAKHGLIVHANEMPAPKEKKAPRLLAAHYGGQDVTFLGRLIFPHVENLVVDARTFPIRDPWPVNPKSLSLVYTFGDSPTDEKRVFVSKAGEDTVWTLTSDDIKTQPPGVTLASAWPPEVPGRIKIYAVIYGLEQITHATVYRRLYEAASRNERIYISNKFFSNSPLINEDPWRGTIKSAAIVYTIRGKWKSISGREREYMSWEL